MKSLWQSSLNWNPERNKRSLLWNPSVNLKTHVPFSPVIEVTLRDMQQATWTLEKLHSLSYIPSPLGLTSPGMHVRDTKCISSCIFTDSPKQWTEGEEYRGTGAMLRDYLPCLWEAREQAGTGEPEGDRRTWPSANPCLPWTFLGAATAQYRPFSGSRWWWVSIIVGQEGPVGGSQARDPDLAA